MHNFCKCFRATLLAFVCGSACHGKVLTVKEMVLVDVGTTLEPGFMANAWVLFQTSNGVSTTIKKLEIESKKIDPKDEANPGLQNASLFKTTADEKAFVQKHLGSIVKHLTTLFDPVRGYKKIVIPLLEESLGVNADSILVKFFNSDQSIAIDAFFSGQIQDTLALKKLCSECSTFFHDLNESLSEPAKKAYQKALQPTIDAIKKAQKQKSVAAVAA